MPSDGSTADVSDYNGPINTIVNEINGNLDNDNIDAAAAIAGSKLANDSIPGTKIATYKVRYQTDDANSIANGTSNIGYIQAGYAQVIGNGATDVSTTITFPTAFTKIYSITATFLGATAADSTPGATILDFEVAGGAVATVNLEDLTLTTVVAHVVSTATLAATRYFAVSWQAIGEI